jgi:hypothetical protein
MRQSGKVGNVMRNFAQIAVIAAASALFAGCGSTPATSITSPSTSSVVTAGASVTAGTIGFALVSDGAPVTSYSESGMQVSLTSADWHASTSYGHPPPFVVFSAAAGTTVTGVAHVTTASPSYFQSVDLYASTTPVPYVITGSRNGATVFTITGNTGNTFGTFRTVTNPNAVQVDALSITLTNTAAPCCSNPMGLDTIVFTDTPPAAPVTHSLNGTVTDSATGAGVPGARVTIIGGANTGTSATADASGAYSFPALTPGSFSLGATATNYLAGSKPITLTDNQTAGIALTRNPNTIPTPVPAGATVVSFSGLTAGTAVNGYAESGVTITGDGWDPHTGYGHPAPFIQFYAEPGTTVSRQINVTAGGAPFTFASVELYSSTTRIPYTITGRRNGAVIFTLTDELPNTFGNFKAVVNNNASPVDTLTIALNNIAASNVRNPMGLDNIAIVK